MTINNERIFIVGGTGNIGIALVHELLDKNAAVTLFTRNPAKINAFFSRILLSVLFKVTLKASQY